jgi:hypothetical protein
MTGPAALSPDGKTLTVRIPFAIRRHGGRKRIVSPDGTPGAPPRPRIDNTLVKALARAHRWKRLLEEGKYASLAELAKAEKINTSYLSRILRVTLLAPDIVEAILDGRQPEELTLTAVLEPFPVEWEGQRTALANRLEP